MKIDRKKVDLLLARKCMSLSDLVKKSGMPETTVKQSISGRGVKPITAGRIAKGLQVDILEILKED